MDESEERLEIFPRAADFVTGGQSEAGGFCQLRANS